MGRIELINYCSFNLLKYKTVFLKLKHDHFCVIFLTQFLFYICKLLIKKTQNLL